MTSPDVRHPLMLLLNHKGFLWVRQDTLCLSNSKNMGLHEMQPTIGGWSFTRTCVEGRF
jgi:hypothetical protein